MGFTGPPALEMGDPAAAPLSSPTEQGSECPTPGCNSRRGGAGLSLPRGTWGYPAPGTRRSEAPDLAQGAALTRSSALSLRTSSLAAEYGLRDATSQRGQPPPTRPVCSVPSWTSGALGDRRETPPGRPFLAPPCKQTRLRFPLPAPAACKARCRPDPSVSSSVKWGARAPTSRVARRIL